MTVFKLSGQRPIAISTRPANDAVDRAHFN